VPQDEAPGGARAVLLSHSGWTRHFSQDPAIVGRAITLDGVDHPVVGILPPDFSLFDNELFVAGLEPALLNSRTTRSMGALGRLAAGVSPDQARVELETIGHLARRVSSGIAAPARRGGTGHADRVCQPGQPAARTSAREEP
jgi:hypothetical protein